MSDTTITNITPMDTTKITPRRPLKELMEEVCRCGRAIIGGDGVVLAYDCPAMVNPVAKLISVHWGTICVLGTVQFAQFGMVKVTVLDIEGEEAVTFMSENPASIFKVLFY